MIKGAKTVGQFKILEFINENFVEGSLKIHWTGDNSCRVYDCNNECIDISYKDDKIEYFYQ